MEYRPDGPEYLFLVFALRGTRTPGVLLTVLGLVKCAAGDAHHSADHRDRVITRQLGT